jgi:ABC-type branched-subunit amino acid transport system permease subunit
MNPFLLVSKFFWAICIVVTFGNAWIFQLRTRPHIQANPELEEGYRAIIKGFVVWNTVPWVVMGIGCVFGGIPSVFSYFRPRDGNPYVLAFFASVLFVLLVTTNWLLFRGGAEMLIKHPGIFNVSFRNKRWIILYWLFCLAGCIVGFVILFSRNISLPR